MTMSYGDYESTFWEQHEEEEDESMATLSGSALKTIASVVGSPEDEHIARQQKRHYQRLYVESGIDLAECLAEYIHFYQLDRQGKPYIFHIKRVYNACRSLTSEQQIAALLHDSLEDAGPGTKNEKIDAHVIRTLFGAHVLEIITALTRRHREDYEYYIRRVAECPDAILIKLADLNDNLDESRGPIEESLRERYIKVKEYLELCIAKGGTEK